MKSKKPVLPSNGKKVVVKNLPLLALKNTAILPHSISPLFIARGESILAINKAMKSADRMIFLSKQIIPDENEIYRNNVSSIGCIASILQCIKLPNDTLKILIDSTKRGRLVSMKKTNGFFEVTAEIKESEDDNSHILQALIRKALNLVSNYLSLSKNTTEDLTFSLKKISEPSMFCDIAISNLITDPNERQIALEIINSKDRIQYLITFLEKEINILHAEHEIQEKVKKQIDKNHKEYYLNEQIKAIQKELHGSNDSATAMADKFKALLKKKKIPPVTKKKIEEEIKRLSHLSPASIDNVRNYLDWVLSMPWGKNTPLTKDTNIIKASNILKDSHYGLKKVKQHILEYLALQLHVKNKSRGSILCLYGPPGVGKTTLAKSIAKSLGRKYAKISLGGVRDEAEIRGHRRTYIGAMPGKLIQSLSRIGVDNPVILLDEIDKTSNDQRGDPQSALLEVLDPDQNNSFQDHYLEVDYDLSKVTFIATANTLSMQRALLDRLEIINVPSYLKGEKVAICQKYIIPKTLKEMNLTADMISFDEDALIEIIKNYTKEAGVRELARLIEKICKKFLLKVMLKDNKIEENDEDIDSMSKLNIIDDKISISKDDIVQFLGIKKYDNNEKLLDSAIGITHGLAYTEYGGEVLIIEAAKMENGSGKIKYTGRLGDIMKESVETAYSYIKSKATFFDIEHKDVKKYDIHVHVPEGATPKDGPSAGIAISTSIMSVLTNKPVRKDIAMTGEITLRGQVLPIGGLREKMTAAIESGIKEIIIPEKNKKDLEEIPQYIKEAIKISPCNNASQVFEKAIIDG